MIRRIKVIFDIDDTDSVNTSGNDRYNTWELFQRIKVGIQDSINIHQMVSISDTPVNELFKKELEDKMFHCESCDRITEPKEKPTKIVTEKRNKIYDNGGRGWEIVKEINVCNNCKPN